MEMNSGDIRRASIEKVVIKLHRARSKDVLTASEKGHAQMARFEKERRFVFCGRADEQFLGRQESRDAGRCGKTMPQSRKTLGRIPQVIA